MGITIHRRSIAEMEERRDAIYNFFLDEGLIDEINAASREELRDIMFRGMLTVEERRLYDELTDIEWLLEQ